METLILDRVKTVLSGWSYNQSCPTTNGRFIGSILEDSIKEYIKDRLSDIIEKFGGPIEYPDITLKDKEGNLYAFEIKTSNKNKAIANRTRSPESIISTYDRYKERWVIAILYDLDSNTRLFRSLEIYFTEFWKYASATFKDMSALAALTNIDFILRKRHSNQAFLDEKEFVEFVQYMSQHRGTTAQRNKASKEWRGKYRKNSK